MEPEFRQSLAMLEYWCNHSNNLKVEEPQPPQEPEYEKEDEVEPEGEVQNRSQLDDTQLVSLTKTREQEEIEAARAVAQSFNKNSAQKSKVAPINDGEEPQKENYGDDLNESCRKELTQNEENSFPKTPAERNAALRKEYEKARAKYEVDLANSQRAASFVFTTRFAPLVICMMQMIASWITEIMNMLIICQSGTVMDVVMDYIALEIIAQIDNIYAEAIRNRISNLIAANEDWQPCIVWTGKKKLSCKTRRWWNSVMYFIWRVMKCFYASFYFYFYPLVVIILSYLVPSNINCEKMDPDEDGYCGNAEL